ncbi:Uncharacterized protein PBTT_05402 [Plasmodiophora brassicae]
MPTPSIVICLLATASQALTIRSAATGQERALTSYGFALGNTTFDVSSTGVLYSLSPENDAWSGRILFVEVTTVTVNVADWANACQRNHCAGLVLHIAPSSLLRTLMQTLAWSYWVRQPGAFATLPIVVVVDDIGAVGASDDVVMAMSPGRIDANPAGAALRLPSIIGAFSCIAVSYFFIVALDALRVLQFAVDDQWKFRAPPWRAVITLVLLVLGHVVRVLRAANTAWYRERAFPYPVAVFITYAELPIMAAARTAMGSIISRSVEAQGHDRSLLMADRAAVVLAVLATIASYIALGIAAVTQVMPLGVVACYLLFLAPSIIYTLSQGYACFVLIMGLGEAPRQVGLASDAIEKRQSFGVRIGATWTIAMLMLALQLLVLAIQNVSPTYFLATQAASQVLGVLAAAATVVMFRPKSSAIGSRCYSRRVAPSSKLVTPVMPATVTPASKRW